jgi:hypothetical protein
MTVPTMALWRPRDTATDTTTEDAMNDSVNPAWNVIHNPAQCTTAPPHIERCERLAGSAEDLGSW